jgi:hypothetical protein
MTQDAILWLVNHVAGPNAEKGPFHCFWCGGTVALHKPPCPAYDAIHAEDTKG